MAAELQKTSDSLIQSNKTNYTFSPDIWTVLSTEFVNKNWSELNIDSCWNMYVQFDIIISTYYSNWRNIFIVTENENEDGRLPAIFISPDSTNLYIACSTTENGNYDLNLNAIPFNTSTKIDITFYNGSINLYYNSVLQTTQSVPGNLILANSTSILLITGKEYPSDGGIQIKNLTFGNLSDSLKCSSSNICLGFEPDNRAYCYGSTEGCLWGQNSCNTDNDCKNTYNITSPKYNGGGDEYCTAPLNTLSSSWPSAACPNIYQENTVSQYSCNYQMSNSELKCYQNNNPDLSGLNSTQLQQNWSTSGCKEKRNNQCPSYESNSGLYNFIGCYNDMCYNGSDGPRALPNYRGLVSSIDQCESLANNNQETFFGVQDGTGIGNGNAQCFTGNDQESATQYGLNVNRNKCGSLGGWCTQQVYQRSTPFAPPQPPQPVLTQADFAYTKETFENKNNKDNENNILLIIFLFIFGIIIFYIYKSYIT